MTCKRCFSYAINHHAHGRDGSDPDLCDVCFWRKRADDKTTLLDWLFENALVIHMRHPIPMLDTMDETGLRLAMAFDKVPLDKP